MSNIKDVYPPPEELIKLSSEEVAPLVFEHLRNQSDRGQMNRYNFTLKTNTWLIEYAGQYIDAVCLVLMEGWVWLEKEGILVPQPGNNGEWFTFSRKAQKFYNAADFSSYRFGNLLPSDRLDPVLAEKVRPLFMKGDYESAIFISYKEVEVRVREVAGLSNNDFGVNLIRKAFNKESGALTLRDADIPTSEKDATSNLFAGAIGLFKNPTSHREVDYSDPSEVAELILFANYLLRLVESKKQLDDTEKM